MKLSDLGEQSLLDKIQSLVSLDPSGLVGRTPTLEIGVGDDAAAWKFGNITEVCTTDTMVAGIHFIPGKTPWVDLGWKAMTSNLSDIAAMGCTPSYCVVTLGLPEDMDVDHVFDLYQGLLLCIRENGGQIVGGDIVRSPILFVTLTLTGITRGRLLRRSEAQLGDLIAVTGSLGASAGGLAISRGQIAPPKDLANYLLEAHNRPQARIAQGLQLVKQGVCCAIDISDGLLDDLGKLSVASQVACQVRSTDVPIAKALLSAVPKDALRLALNGGEDYELVFTASQAIMKSILIELVPPPTIIGEIVAGSPGKVTLLDAQSRPQIFDHRGWDHFAHQESYGDYHPKP